MKNVHFIFALLLFTNASNAQSEKFSQAMKTQISKIEQAFQSGDLPELSNSFERIADAEKNQWLPYYYAAYCTVVTAMTTQDKSKIDALADKADALISKAETTAGAANSETAVIRSMIATAHLMVDPPSRWMQYGQLSAGYIDKAKELDPTNPRPYYLEGQSKFFTPEQFGGGKSIAAPIFEKALSLFDAFKPASDLAPVWGKSSTEYFLSQCK